MMKRILAASAAIASVSLLAAPAFATTSNLSQSITLTGTVDPSCAVQNTVPATQTISNLANSDGTLNASAISAQTFDFGTVWCNGAHSTLAVSASPLTNSVTNPDSVNFTNVVNYKINTKLGSTSLGSLDSSAPDPTTYTVGIFSGDVTVAGSADTETRKLVAGTYTATITATLTPVT